MGHRTPLHWPGTGLGLGLAPRRIYLADVPYGLGLPYLLLLILQTSRIVSFRYWTEVRP
ncbi:hypothetical protein LX32DRAFT_635970 [Colletotrichum zoysiae]|uniref:Uncharacterized protein n=1 Tax=Colletotrichum zoysiae TaxID=1216348 RepID=A0AAD9HRN4_9PEZI|nr:hypothetical protein LX32DRAFT_635970 [Colletotrichum zoysiae]